MEDHMVEEEEVICKVCVQLVYYLVGVCFIKEEMNCFCVMFVFMVFFMILFAICSNSNCSYKCILFMFSSTVLVQYPNFMCINFFYS